MAENKQTTLTSDWGGLNPLLLASFYEVDREGIYKPDTPVVKAAVTDGNIEVTLNWQSPFENAGPETKAPTLFALLQTGSFQPIMDLMNSADKGGDKGVQLLQKYEGRAGITKLNSTQVFNGMPPARVALTLLFRAWMDPVKEVEIPFNRLMSWALPKTLAKDSVLVNGLDRILGKNEKDWIETILPSESPTLIGVSYKGRCYSPLVIENIGDPISSPIDQAGNYVSLSVPLSLATLTAIDKNDWNSAKWKNRKLNRPS